MRNQIQTKSLENKSFYHLIKQTSIQSAIIQANLCPFFKNSPECLFDKMPLKNDNNSYEHNWVLHINTFINRELTSNLHISERPHFKHMMCSL